MKKKLALITGANGQIGTVYQLTSGKEDWDYLFLGREDLDVSKLTQVESVFASFAPDVCVNLAGYRDVDKCEKEELESSFDVNANGVRNLGIAGSKFNVPIIHVSSAFVFDGKKDGSYAEKDTPCPINNYGRTMLMGEKYLRDVTDHYFIIRTSWVFSNYGDSFYSNMLRKAQQTSEIHGVVDNFGSPTSAKELCRAIDAVIEQSHHKELSGIYHFSGRGKVSWKDYADEIFKQGRISMIVNPTISDSFKHVATRPSNMYLNSDNFAKTFGYSPQHWKNSLREVITERKSLPIKVGDVVMNNGVACVVVTTDWSRKIASLAEIDKMTDSFEIPIESLELYERQ